MRSVAATLANPGVVFLAMLLSSTGAARAADDFVLLVDPLTGHVAIRSDFSSTVWITEYTITSVNSLTPFGWNSLDDQNVAPFDWRENLFPSPAMLAEAAFTGATSFQDGTGFPIGAIFNPATNRDLTFRYRLAGDATLSVGSVSYAPLTIPPAPTQVLLPVYEGFDYAPSTDLLGAGGGTGFAEPWEAPSVNADFEIGAGSLPYPVLATAGNRVATVSHNSGIGSIGRRLITPLGINNTTRYVSFMVRPEGTLNEGQFNGFFGLRLETPSGTDLFVGKAGGGAVDQFVLESAGGTLQHATGTTVEIGKEYLLVLRADFTPSGNDVFTLYVNPSPGAPEPTSGTVKNDVNLSMINEIFLYATGAFSIDEVRIGASFADVVPTIPGDYNLDGDVDAADYVVWRNNFGSPMALPGDDTPGVGPDDYDRWKTHFGDSDGSGGAAVTTVSVPEPSSMLWLVLAAASWCVIRASKGEADLRSCVHAFRH